MESNSSFETDKAYTQLNERNAENFYAMDDLSIVFPIFIKVAVADNKMGTIRIQDNAHLYIIVEVLPEETSAAIVYPILITDRDGNYNVVRSDAQFDKITNLTN